MSWTLEQLLAHKKRNSLLGGVNQKKQQESTGNESVSEKSSTIVLPETAPVNNGVCSFVVPGAAMGKPRMTRSDKWKKRPKVMRYREFADRCRAASGRLPPNPVSIVVVAWLPMPASWSDKKKHEQNGQIVRSTPDWDNIGKAVCDALFEQDSVLGGGTCWKFWCPAGQEHTQITVLYAREQGI